MKKYFILIAIAALVACSKNENHQEDSSLSYKSLPETYNKQYMGADVKLIEAPNGAIVNSVVLNSLPQVVYIEPTVENLGNGIWVLGGYSVANCAVIETDEGLIVFETGDYAEEGRHFRKVIEEQISKKPIIAIIYSHSHYALGGGAMVDNPENLMVIGHPMLNQTVNENLEGGGFKSAIPELGPVMSARASVHFSNYLPDEGVDAPIAGKLEFHEPAFLPVTRTVSDGEKLKVGGLELQFFTEYKSDDYNLTVWIPSKQAALNNFYWPGTPNLYSLRGASYRDPQEWRNGLTVIRNLNPEYLISTHARTVIGKKEVMKTLNNYTDLITLTYDQSLRGILNGLGPDELRSYVYKPKHLAEPAYNKELYGETSWFTPATFYYGLGWYDRDVTKLFQIPVDEQATRLVENMGGRSKVLSLVEEAFSKKEYAWAAQLVNYLSQINPKDTEVRGLKAKILRKLGQISPSFIGRAFAISNARDLEGQITIPRVQLPSSVIVAKSPEMFLNYFRIRIDPKKTENIDKVIAFTFDNNTTVGLHVRRGIAEFVQDLDKHYRPVDIAISLNAETWAKLYLNETDMDKEIQSNNVMVTKGSVEEIAEIYEMFDKFIL